MFNVGDILEYLGEPEGRYTAVVTSSNETRTTCTFYSTGFFRSREKGYSYGDFTFPNSSYKLKEAFVPLTIEEKVLKKIKLLDERYAKHMAEKKAKEKYTNAIRPKGKSITVQNEQQIRQDASNFSWSTPTSAANFSVSPTNV